MSRLRSGIAALLILAVLLQSFSLLSIKYSTLREGLWSLVLLLVALGFLAVRALIWQFALKRADITRIYPVTALVQVLVFAYAVVLFGETVEPNNVVGLALMLGGVVLASAVLLNH
jgi:drug/metabolite transporter (DMT)-like permease